MTCYCDEADHFCLGEESGDLSLPEVHCGRTLPSLQLPSVVSLLFSHFAFTSHLASPDTFSAASRDFRESHAAGKLHRLGRLTKLERWGCCKGDGWWG